MQAFAMFCKSYSGDFEYAKRMVGSFHSFNRDDISLYIVVPETDLDLFRSIAGSNVEVLSEELLAQHLVDRPVHGMRAGYINQEIIKLAFWELKLAANYFCVDSDAEFIRDFSISDFMYDSNTPFSVLVQDLELAVEPDYYQQYWISREQELTSIFTEVGLDPRVILTCHGHTVLSAKVIESFATNFLEPRGWSYSDALEFSPYEFTWYNAWLLKSHEIPIHAREPWIKVFHNRAQHVEYQLRGISPADIARGYLGVVVNSNYSRDLGVVNSQDPQSEIMAAYLSYSQALRILGSKAKATLSRRNPFNTR